MDKRETKGKARPELLANDIIARSFIVEDIAVAKQETSNIRGQIDAMIKWAEKFLSKRMVVVDFGGHSKLLSMNMLDSYERVGFTMFEVAGLEDVADVLRTSAEGFKGEDKKPREILFDGGLDLVALREEIYGDGYQIPKVNFAPVVATQVRKAALGVPSL